MKNKKRNRILLGVGITLGVITLAIAPIGPVASLIVGGIFSGRASGEESIGLNQECFVYRCRDEIANLSERKTVSFKSGSNDLTAYLYSQPSPKGLVITAHGLSSQSDGVDANYQSYFFEKGWNVLAVDLTASGRSDGNTHFLDQSAYDVSRAVKFASTFSETANLPICLVGHSWGGYGVLAANEYVQNVKAVCAFASFIQPDLEMIESARKKMGEAAMMTKWCMDMGLMTLRGETGFLNAAEAMQKNPNAKVILVQGEDDTTVTSYSSSFHKAASFGADRTTAYYLENRGHSDLFYSDAAITYKKDVVDPKLSALGDWNKLTSSEREAFASSIDKSKTSELNQELFDNIESIFAEAVR